MNILEEAVLFACAGETLIAIMSRPASVPAEDSGPCPGTPRVPPATTEQELVVGPATSPPQRARHGVLMIVGGPQYRVGSHRQFLLLARRLAAAGYPVMRFDYRGMGDSSGTPRPFDQVADDIAAAMDAFQRHCPGLQSVILWGLCDAASAALLYVESRPDKRIAGLVVLNPWVRSEASLAQTHIKHYYGRRLLKREFWSKLFSGRLAVMTSLCGLLRAAIIARRGQTRGAVRRSFQERMADGWRNFPGLLLLILSGEDYTAKEFIEFTGASPAWSGLIEAANVKQVRLADADHTFSSRIWRKQAEDATLEWLNALTAT